jgi:hypothetical protein
MFEAYNSLPVHNIISVKMDEELHKLSYTKQATKNLCICHSRNNSPGRNYTSDKIDKGVKLFIKC